MPIIKADDAPVRQETPEDCDAELGPYRAVLLSDAGGLSQFGAVLETLPPGSTSSRTHWHENEDEFVYVLEGTVTLIEGDASNEMTAGDAATFKAGVAIGHCLTNRSTENAVYLVVGARSRDDVVHYPDNGLIQTKTDGEKRLTNLSGAPATFET